MQQWINNIYKDRFDPSLLDELVERRFEPLKRLIEYTDRCCKYKLGIIKDTKFKTDKDVFTAAQHLQCSKALMEAYMVGLRVGYLDLSLNLFSPPVDVAELWGQVLLRTRS